MSSALKDQTRCAIARAYSGPSYVPLGAGRIVGVMSGPSERRVLRRGGTDGSAVRVLVVTAPVGEGHMTAARTLSEDISRDHEGTEVMVCDALPALWLPLRWLLNDAYRWQLRSAPWLFGLLFGALRRSRVLRSLARAGVSLAGSRGLLRLIRRHRADVIVSTWPVSTTILGCLRLRGKVRVPVCATITDFAGLELWADKGVDLHLVMHENLVAGVERIAGRGSARPVSPLVASQFLTPRSAAEARRALGLPAEATIVVVSGGGGRSVISPEPSTRRSSSRTYRWSASPGELRRAACVSSARTPTSRV